MLGSSLIDNSLFSMNGPHMGYHVLQRFTKETLESLPILSLTIGRTRNVADSTNHSLYLIKMLSSCDVMCRADVLWVLCAVCGCVLCMVCAVCVLYCAIFTDKKSENV